MCTTDETYLNTVNNCENYRGINLLSCEYTTLTYARIMKNKHYFNEAQNRFR